MWQCGVYYLRFIWSSCHWAVTTYTQFQIPYRDPPSVIDFFFYLNTESVFFLLSFFLLQTVSSSGQGCPESPVYTNLQELKISQASLPPQPSGSPLHVLGDWEMHRDQSGRHFYYNRSTQERTWKPPRARDASSLNSRGENHSAGESSEVRDMKYAHGSSHSHLARLSHLSCSLNLVCIFLANS